MAKKNKKLKHAQGLRKKSKQGKNKHKAASHLHMFQQALSFHQAGRLPEAEAFYRRALSLKKDYAEALCNLGNVLHGQDRLDEAATCLKKAVTIKPDYVEAHYNLGVVLQDLGKLDEAVSSYNRSLALKPNFAEALHNLGTILSEQGKLEEAVKLIQGAVNNAPENVSFSDSLINLLNHFMPGRETGSSYVKAQMSLQQVKKEYTGTAMIADEAVRRHYQQCSSILAQYDLDANSNKTQLFRGKVSEDDCQRHTMVFNKFNIIPEYCFDCFKVIFEPRSVMELFKLFFVFEKLKLPGDNTRKCMVETRPKMPGTYKGFIYCKKQSEGKEILKTVQPILDTAIAKGIPTKVKRGCSEFQLAYPAYGHIDKDKSQQMSYKEEWRKYELYADKNMKIKLPGNPNNFTTYNHSGFTLLDILVMRNWLKYASRIGDLSYLDIAE